uniref:Single-stranded DNA binding protein Ssb-like OB fold domain-containing protein n=1 Tax=Spongospora subterranea TaxID=70186 RepID=A0A0H5QJM4_9EUKA|eukprot:CRZ01822.1 hypothetical protein [Spongospora subterranea]
MTGLYQTECIILEKNQVSETADGSRICQCLVADGSAAINLSLWDKQIDALEVADIITITGGTSSLYKDALSIHVRHPGSIARTGNFTKVFVETPNVSSWRWKKDPTTKGFVRA